MENINLIVVDSNEEVTGSIKKYFEVRSNINVVGCFKNGEEALGYIVNNAHSFDVIVMDLLLPKMDGVSLLHNLKKRNINKKIIVLSSYLSEQLLSQISNLGVDYYMLKPFDIESLEERVQDLFKVSKVRSNKDANIEIEISEILHNLGVPSHIRGYQYMRDGIMYLYNRNSFATYITKEVYPEIADKYKTTPSRVERAMRHAIEISWDRGDLNLMEDLFGHSIDFNKSKPTNSEYINTVADRVKLKNNIHNS